MDKKKVIGIIITVSIMFSVVYYIRTYTGGPVEYSFNELNRRYIEAIEGEREYSMWNKRILFPYTQAVGMWLLSPVFSYKSAFKLTQATMYFILSFLFFCLSYRYLSIWFSQERALLGMLIMACSMFFTTTVKYMHSTQIEMVVYVLALLLIYHRKDGWLFIVVLIATLNRETTIFVPLIYYVTTKDWKRTLFYIAGILMVSTFLNYYVVGSVNETSYNLNDLRFIFIKNIERFPTNVGFSFIFLGMFWWYAIRGFWLAPDFVRKSAIVILPYMFCAMTWGLWAEARLYAPLYPVFLSLGMSYLWNDGT